MLSILGPPEIICFSKKCDRFDLKAQPGAETLNLSHFNRTN